MKKFIFSSLVLVIFASSCTLCEKKYAKKDSVNNTIKQDKRTDIDFGRGFIPTNDSIFLSNMVSNTFYIGLEGVSDDGQFRRKVVKFSDKNENITRQMYEILSHTKATDLKFFFYGYIPRQTVIAIKKKSAFIPEGKKLVVEKIIYKESGL